MPGRRDAGGGGGHDRHIIAVEECGQPAKNQHPPVQGAEPGSVHELFNVESHAPPFR